MQAPVSDLDSDVLAELIYDATNVGGSPWRNLMAETQLIWAEGVRRATRQLAEGTVAVVELAQLVYTEWYGHAKWVAMHRDDRALWCAQVRQAVTAMASPAETNQPEVSPYLFGEMTAEAAREMLGEALTDLRNLHVAECGGGDPALCEREEYRKLATRLQHALDSLPVRQPGEPVTLHAVVRVRGNLPLDGGDEAGDRYYRRYTCAPAGAECWETFGGSQQFRYSEIVKFAQRRRVTIEILTPTQG